MTDPTKLRALLADYNGPRQMPIHEWHAIGRQLTDSMPALLDRLDALESVAKDAAELVSWDWARMIDDGAPGDVVRADVQHLRDALSALTPTTPEPKERT